MIKLRRDREVNNVWTKTHKKYSVSYWSCQFEKSVHQIRGTAELIINTITGAHVCVLYLEWDLGHRNIEWVTGPIKAGNQVCG